MKARVAAILLLAFAAASGAPAAETGANPFRLKPGAKGKTCLGCHEEFADTLKLPFVHTPVKQGDCADCHNPHASKHGKLLGASANEICAKCHQGIGTVKGKSIHQAVADGNCVKCHDPHGSKNPASLVASGNELCFGCHADVSKAVSSASFRHPPVTKSCLGCHTPHASPGADNLLKKTDPALCADCHRPADPAFAARHKGYPVDQAPCSTCHSPHGSSSRGMLWANVHAPVADGACAQCHEAASSAEPLAVKRDVPDLCRTCHKDTVDDALSKPHVHGPVLGKDGCLACHNPHAADGPALMRGPTKAVCGECHADTLARIAESAVKHPPVEEGKCTACHAPHASTSPLLLTVEKMADLCGTCHDWEEHTGHPIGEKIADPRNPNLGLDCSSCHRPHASSHKHLAHLDTKGDLCVQCHEQLKR